MSSVDLLEEIQTLVSDRLQVVSYKWLSRNYSLPSNVAKRLLQEYVDKYGQSSKVIYALSGWLKTDPSAFLIQLVSASTLEESKLEFGGECSVQVYSVQASLPKDPATLWNTDFIQSEELYKQPAAVINCFRDNRFGGISNSSIQRTVDGFSVSISSHQSKDVIAKSVPSFSQQSKVSQVKVETSVQPSKLSDTAKTATDSAGANEPLTDKSPLPNLTSKKKGQTATVNTGNGESLSSMWGRAPKKLSTTPLIEETDSSIQADDAQMNNKRPEFDDSDDEGKQVNVKRSSQKIGRHKRRVVMDSSDEDDNDTAINLSSPDVPKEKSGSFQRPNIESPKTDNGASHVVEVKIDDDSDRKSRTTMQKDKKTEHKDCDAKIVSKSSLGDVKKQVSESSVKRKANMDNPVPVPASPKRKKVLKTHIDGKGREVTEVVWEGEDEKKKAEEATTTKKTDGNSDQTTINRPVGQNRKSPAVGSSAPPNQSGKAGNKKTSNAKDPKQGNIMSFFKRV